MDKWPYKIKSPNSFHFTNKLLSHCIYKTQKWGKGVNVTARRRWQLRGMIQGRASQLFEHPGTRLWRQATYTVYSPMLTGHSVAVTTVGQNQDDQWFKQACQGYEVVSAPDDLFLLCRGDCPRHILKRCDRLSPISTFSHLIFFHSTRIFFSLAFSDGFLWLCLRGVARAFTALFYDA